MKGIHYLRDLTGTLHYKDTPLCYFSMVNREIVNSIIYTTDFLPPEIYQLGINYSSINSFFQYRVVRDYAQYIGEYLESLGLKYYDFEEIVKRNNGWNHSDYYWMKFDYFGARGWKEIQTQEYPIYRD